MTAYYNCIHCGKEKPLTKSVMGVYCSNQCQRDYISDEKIKYWKQGGKIYYTTIRRYLIKKLDGKCSECGLNEWNGKPLMMEFEHIDGNFENDSEENVTLLCPNCHSQTLTFKNRNKGNGRYIRRQKYKDGKSY